MLYFRRPDDRRINIFSEKLFHPKLRLNVYRNFSLLNLFIYTPIFIINNCNTNFYLHQKYWKKQITQQLVNYLIKLFFSLWPNRIKHDDVILCVT